MKTRPIAAALILSLVPATFPVRAWAQPADDATTSMARARFKEGVEFYDKGEFEQARASFLQAYALKKHPAVLLNLAWSCLKSGHAMEAEKYFKQFLSEGKDITDKQRADANDGLNQSHNKLGRIEVSAVPGTEVTVDGEKVGTTPLMEPVSVEAGAHTVKFKASDGTTETQSVTVMGGEKAVARFKAAGNAAAAAGTGTAAAGAGTGAGSSPTEGKTTEPEKTPTPETKTPENASKTAEEPAKKEAPVSEGGGGAFAAPNNVVPAVILGSVAVAATAGAVIMLVFKNSAQNNANTVQTEIVNNLPAGRNASGICTTNTPTNFKQACADYSTDVNQVNQDATAGNIFAGVAIASAVGAVIYWVVADKAPLKSGYLQPVVTPTVGYREGGLSLSMKF